MKIEEDSSYTRTSVRKNKEASFTFVRLKQKKQETRKLKLLSYLNRLLMFLALCSLILEFVVFSLEHWFIDLSLFLQLSFLTFNLCLVILNSDS